LELKGPFAFLKKTDLDATQKSNGVNKYMVFGFLKMFIFASRDKFVNASRYNMQINPTQYNAIIINTNVTKFLIIFIHLFIYL
jgi:hypothetical protein